jgi:hypothetical protein
VPITTTQGPPRDHRVEFYDHDAVLVQSVVDFLRPALAAVVAVVVATPAHRQALGSSLLPAAPLGGSARGRLMMIDAEQALEQLMIDGLPDPSAFRTVIGGLLQEASASPGPTLVFGEMVAVLWERGAIQAAIALEDLWNDLAADHAFGLLCGYPTVLFESGVPAQLEAVCARHTAVTVAPGSALAVRTPMAPFEPAPHEAVQRYQFPGARTSGALARRQLRALLSDWGLTGLVDDALLLTTELINNAVLHAESPVLVSVRRRVATVRVEVTDVGDGAIRRPVTSLRATHGRGLLLVDRVASAWGTSAGGDSKTVWFELGDRRA